MQLNINVFPTTACYHSHFTLTRLTLEGQTEIWVCSDDSNCYQVLWHVRKTRSCTELAKLLMTPRTKQLWTLTADIISVSDRYSSLITFLNGLYSLERLKDIITLRFTSVIRSVHFSISILQNAITPVFKKGKQLREILKTIGWGFHSHIHFKLTRTLFLQTITTLTSLVSKPKQLNCRTVHLHGVI